jgi:phosphatidylglycerol:prolipoprotein diacylglycerol transferase
MRTRLVDYLNHAIGLEVFNWIIPTPTIIGAIAYTFVAVVFIKRCKSIGLEKRSALYIIFIGGITALIGARFFYVILNLKGFMLQPLDILSVNSGTGSWGVYIGSAIGTIFYLGFKREPILPYLDVLGSSIAIGTFVGRWSCFMAGCCFGKVSDVVWAVRYPNGSLAYAKHVKEGLISYSSPLSLPVHPSQIYLSLNALFLFIFLSYFWKTNRYKVGLSFGVYWLVYSISRFFIEFYRDAPRSRLLSELNTPQIMCVFIIILSILFIALLYRRNIGRLITG